MTINVITFSSHCSAQFQVAEADLNDEYRTGEKRDTRGGDKRCSGNEGNAGETRSVFAHVIRLFLKP